MKYFNRTTNRYSRAVDVKGLEDRAKNYWRLKMILKLNIEKVSHNMCGTCGLDKLVENEIEQQAKNVEK